MESENLKSPAEPAGMRWLRTETFACGGQTHTVDVYRCEVFATALGLAANATDPTCEFVKIPDHPLLMARTEVTQAVWEHVMGENPAHNRDPRRPVETITYDDAERFCEATGQRLPSLEEWEIACQAGATTAYYCGDDEGELAAYAWFGGGPKGVRETHQVAGKRPNAFGLFDMLGNVREWCCDEVGNARGDGLVSRYTPGGSFQDSAWNCRSKGRDAWYWPDDASNALGLRTVFTLSE